MFVLSYYEHTTYVVCIYVEGHIKDDIMCIGVLSLMRTLFPTFKVNKINWYSNSTFCNENQV